MDHHSKPGLRMRLTDANETVYVSRQLMIDELAPHIGADTAAALLDGKRVDVEVDDEGKKVLERLMPSVRRHVQNRGKRSAY